MKKKYIVLLGVCVVAAGAYYLMKPEKNAGVASTRVVPVEHMAANDEDKRIWQSTEDENEDEETATESSSALPNDIRESADEKDEAPDAEKAGSEEKVSFWNSLGKIRKTAEDSSDESSSAYQESLDIPPHKKEMYWLKQVLSEGEDEEAIPEADPKNSDHHDAAMLEQTADTVSHEIMD